MPVQFKNFEYWFLNEKDKPIFVPNSKGYEIGLRLKKHIEKSVKFEDFYFHFQPGGHVAAIHSHRKNNYFAKVDLKNFFYSIPRNRVARTLHEIGIPKARFHAKFSCVKNPYEFPTYSLPYGFVQSPILATLVLSQSSLGSFLLRSKDQITISVYMDDIALSSPEHAILRDKFDELKLKIHDSNFVINEEKTVAPTNLMQLFNCELEKSRTSVTESRRTAFYNKRLNPFARHAFGRYCLEIERGNKS